MKRCLNLGCGRDYREDTVAETWHNVDHCEDVVADRYFDLEETPWSLATNDYDLCIANHVLEHLHNLTHVMEQIYRVCKPGATVEIEVPHWAHLWAWGDPDHKRVIPLQTFSFFNRDFIEKEVAKPNSPMTPVAPKCDFRVRKVSYGLAPEAVEWFTPLDKKAQEWCLRHLVNVIDALMVELEVIKSG